MEGQGPHPGEGHLGLMSHSTPAPALVTAKDRKGLLQPGPKGAGAPAFPASQFEPQKPPALSPMEVGAPEAPCPLSPMEVGAAEAPCPLPHGSGNPGSPLPSPPWKWEQRRGHLFGFLQGVVVE